MTSHSGKSISVLIPAYNEELTIRKVVSDFRAALPEADVVVFDNNSTDATAAEALSAGARVVRSLLQGKGHVVRHMFEEVDTDYSLMVDGDDTYPAAAASDLLDAAISGNVDMVIGARLDDYSGKAFRRFHMFGNHVISGLISTLFRVRITDALSGYRVFSRAFTESVPVTSSGFQVETELTLQAITKHFKIREIPIAYGSRPPGSHSKLNTYRDGMLVISTIVLLFRDYKPLLFFSSVAGMFAIASLVVGSTPIIEYYRTGLVPHFPSAILAASLALCALVSFAIGIVLDTLHKYHRENFEIIRKFRRAVRKEDS